MWRYLVGAASMLGLVGAGFALSRYMAQSEVPLPVQPAYAAEASGPPPAAPRADEMSKEEKRFNRYDRDRNGAVARDEFLLSRQKAFAKLDTNGDGKLSFDEYAVKSAARFAKADGNRSGGLDRTEFATTRPVRKAKPKPKADCPPVAPQPSVPAAEDEAEG